MPVKVYPQCGVALAAPEPLPTAQQSLYAEWHGGNDCIFHLHYGSILLSKGNGLMLLCIMQNPPLEDFFCIMNVLLLESRQYLKCYSPDACSSIKIK